MRGYDNLSSWIRNCLRTRKYCYVLISLSWTQHSASERFMQRLGRQALTDYHTAREADLAIWVATLLDRSYIPSGTSLTTWTFGLTQQHVLWVQCLFPHGWNGLSLKLLLLT